MSTVRSRSLLLLMPLAALSLAACGDDSSGSNTTSQATAVTTVAGNTTAADTTPANATPAGGPTTLRLADNRLGRILVDADGNTLYLFGNDAPNAPACSTGCLGTWPALISDGAATVGDGLDLAEVGTVTAADGSTQVTFYGHPLYSFAGDAAPGDANGQGIGGIWYVVDADGNAVK